MRNVFRALAIVLTLGFILNLATAQKSIKELPDGADADLTKPGTDEAHQGADNPMQGSRGKRDGNPDPYGGESFQDFIEKSEMKFNDPQWQLKLDMQHPKRIVIDNPDGSSKEYWYVLFRVINDNTRKIKDTTLPTTHTDDIDLGNPKDPLEVTDNTGGADEREGVPADAHLDFELHVFNRDIERDPWDTEWPADPENEVLSPEALEQRRANMKRVFKPISDHYVLQRVAAAEGLYEWNGNYDYINEPVMLLHPLSDFQRQIGYQHQLSAPDYSGPRCLPYRFVVIKDGERSEENRYVAIYGDNTFAGFFGQGDTLPDGARLVDNPDDAMWGNLTIRRYLAGDCVDRYGRPLRANDPGYLNARIAGGRNPEESTGYGMLKADHPAVGQPVVVPHVRVYKDGDKVLFDHNTELKHKDNPNATYIINGKIVGPGDPRFDTAEEVSSSTEKFGGSVVGKPVKQVDQRGRAIRRYIVTYQAGDVLTQAEWDIYKRRLGPAILARYKDTGNIVGRPLTANDPVVGMPKIKMGHFIGDEGRKGEVIDRGIDTGRRGPNGEVILQSAPGFDTGREYNAREIGPEDFMRDPEGEFTTNRKAPVPDDNGLNDGEEYIYAPLGNPVEGAVPVPAFDQYGAWKNYVDELSGSEIPLYDEKGDLVRDMQDQIYYLKEYEYEYVYMYEFAPVSQEDSGFKGEYGGERYKLVSESVRFAIMPKKVPKKAADGTVTDEIVEVALPLTRLIYETRTVDEPVIIDGFEYHDPETGKVTLISAAEYEQKTGAAPDPAKVVNAKIVTTTKTEDKVVVGIFVEGKTLGPNQTAEDWAEAEERVKNEGGRVEPRDVIGYVSRFRNDHAAKEDPSQFEGTGPKADEFEESERRDNGADFDKLYKTWTRWTVPPPMVYRDEQGQWQVITRFADKIGPGTRWDDKDAPRFLTRYVSEMWGVAIFEGVSRDWDFANVYVRGLRDRVSGSGFKQDSGVPDLPSPVDGSSPVTKSFFKPRMVSQEWIYRVRYERLGDEYENFRDLIRKTRSFWYLDKDPANAETELGN